MNDYVEVEVKVNPRQPGSDLLVSQLAENGFESFADTPDGFQAWIPHAEFKEDTLSIVNQLDSELGRAEYSWKIIPGRNWNAEWEASYQPVRIDNRLLIRAPFHEPDPTVKMELVIQPQQSFGTGHHPTTLLIAEKLLTMALGARYIMDLGCGTGVLAILASKLGAGKVEGVDIEIPAVENAMENARNNSAGSIVFSHGDASVLHGKKYDVILANINKNILKAAMPVFNGSLHEGGDLLLSGFFVTDADELIGTAGDGFELQEVKNSGEWAMVHLRRKTSGV
ncbi:MAG TPA: 50S ribosomal protein L11 methyltransferase [Bacteroidia bacterium]|nr:50S ribosomal protein L11 methyltransferase [Bacteroidia bacterium]